MNPSTIVGKMDPHVPDTAFGKWILQTNKWTVHVVDRAIKDLDRLIPNRQGSYSVVADVGCAWGRSLKKLNDLYSPQRLLGIDIDPEMLEISAKEAAKAGVVAEFIHCSSSRLHLLDNSGDVLFCHQSFYHLIHQELAIAEFLRVLKPGGILLFAESTRRYIHSWFIKLLFREPKKVQITAPEYLKLVRDADFYVAPESISYPLLWWRREDLGIGKKYFSVVPPLDREETLINLAAVKPIA